MSHFKQSFTLHHLYDIVLISSLTNSITRAVLIHTYIYTSHEYSVIVVDLILQGRLPFTEVIQRLICPVTNL